MINCVINDVDDVCELRNKFDEILAAADENKRKKATQARRANKQLMS